MNDSTAASHVRKINFENRSGGGLVIFWKKQTMPPSKKSLPNCFDIPRYASGNKSYTCLHNSHSQYTLTYFSQSHSDPTGG